MVVLLLWPCPSTSPGARDLTVGPSSPCFSINGGATDLEVYNNPATAGGASDWVGTLVRDSYGFGYKAIRRKFPRLISLNLVLGYKLTTAGLTATQTLGLA